MTIRHSLLYAPIRFWRALPPVPRIVVSTLIIIFLLLATRPQAPQQPTHDRYPRVSYETAQPAAIAPQIRLFGQVQSPANALMRAAVTGTVDSTPALSGHQVRQGDVLIRLDRREAELALAQRQAELDQAEALYASAQLKHQSDLAVLAQETRLLELAQRSVARYESLQGKGVGSDMQLDQARQNVARQQISLNQRKLVIADYDNTLAQLKAQVTRARALRDQAALDLERTTLHAPFDGRVSALHVAPGERVRPGDMLLNLYATAQMEIRAQIPERHLPTVRAALQHGPMNAYLQTEAHQMPLQLTRLAGAVSPGSGGLDGLFQLLGTEFIPELGRTADTFLSLPAQPQLIALPSSALHGMDRVYRLIPVPTPPTDDPAQLEAVQVTRAGDWFLPNGEQRVLVFSEQLRAGDKLMTTQLPSAISGLQVHPTGGQPTPVPAPAEVVTEPAR